MTQNFTNGHADSENVILLATKTLNEARTPEVIGLPLQAEKHPESVGIRVEKPKSLVWEWLELGFLLTLTSSVVFSMLAVVVAAGNAVE